MHIVVIIVQTLELKGEERGRRKVETQGGDRDSDGDRKCTNVA